MRFTSLFVTFALFCNVHCIRFDTRCKLVRELIKVGIPNDLFLGQWVCLAEKVSNRDTRAFIVTPSGRKTYGIFQIPSRWCRQGKKGGECNIACELFNLVLLYKDVGIITNDTSWYCNSLLDDDIRDDTACAVFIFHKEGFKYWSKWNSRCKNDKLITQEIYKCPDLMHRHVKTDTVLQSEVLKTKRQHSENIMERWGVFNYG